MASPPSGSQTGGFRNPGAREWFWSGSRLISNDLAILRPLRIPGTVIHSVQNAGQSNAEENLMINPVDSLVISIQKAPGDYALLLGSGVSRAAKIPTGWEITLDLIRQIAVLRGESSDADHEKWYQDTFGKDPNYAELLGALGITASERQQLLRSYVEPNDQERQAGEKCPTAAHHAIANLVKQGYVQVIITTNFDRLIESALKSADVEPTVVKSPDDLMGLPSLRHVKCCVIKVHGDYLDTRIKNTPQELSQYPREIDEFLDGVFADYGLIVCGWSAEWDGALRDAIRRAPVDRFSMYWTTVGELEEKAHSLVDHCQARVISIEGANEFFVSIQERVGSLRADAQSESHSDEVAIASLKDFIAEPRFRIKLQDLVNKVVEQTIEVISGESFSVHDPPFWTTENVTDRVRRYEEACSILLSMATEAGYWAEEEHYSMWRRVLERISSVRGSSGRVNWLDLQYYPSTLLLYALGIGAVENGRLLFLKSLLSIDLPSPWRYFDGAPKLGKVVNILPPFCMFRNSSNVIRVLEGMEKYHAPLNERLFRQLRQHANDVIPDPGRYNLAFVELEILIALGGLVDDGLFTPGIFCYKREARNSVLQKINVSLTRLRDHSPYVTCGIFGNSSVDCLRILASLLKHVQDTRWSLL